MAGITDVQGVEVFGKGRGSFRLPCGYVDPSGKAHRTIVMREVSGDDSDPTQRVYGALGQSGQAQVRVLDRES